MKITFKKGEMRRDTLRLYTSTPPSSPHPWVSVFFCLWLRVTFVFVTISCLWFSHYTSPALPRHSNNSLNIIMHIILPRSSFSNPHLSLLSVLTHFTFPTLLRKTFCRGLDGRGCQEFIKCSPPGPPHLPSCFISSQERTQLKIIPYKLS